MALNWDFKKDRIGTAYKKDGGEYTLYTGNALLIALYETEKTYQLAWFFCDEQHAKNCLGLTKGYDGCWENFGIRKLSLNVKFKETGTILKLLHRAKAEVEIELFNPPF